MATTTNYGWAEPDNTSLVKNGAQDIRILGDAIDASVWNIGFGQAGKNKIINGDFGIWQRGTSFNASTLFYTADRWQAYSYSGASQTVSQQSFTVGTAPVSGYESQYFLRATATNTGINIEQRIEDVRTFAGQPVTLSYWAKSNSAQTITTYVNQNFGSGGSSQVTAITGTQAITTSWTRYTLSGTVTSITGKTIGTSSYLQVNFVGATINNALDIWGVQLEYGSKATPFETASGTIQGELALCQRYFYRAGGDSVSDRAFASGIMVTTTIGNHVLQWPVQMRTAPTIAFSAAGTFYLRGGGGAAIPSAMGSSGITTQNAGIEATRAATTANLPSFLQALGAANAYIDASAEL
jgi:hypothetical protein